MSHPFLSSLLLFAGLTLIPAAPVLANDFYQRPPVPSSRDETQTSTRTARTTQLNKALRNSTLKRKIVKNIKTGNSGRRPKASLQ